MTHIVSDEFLQQTQDLCQAVQALNAEAAEVIAKLLVDLDRAHTRADRAEAARGALEALLDEVLDCSCQNGPEAHLTMLVVPDDLLRRLVARGEGRKGAES